MKTAAPTSRRKFYGDWDHLHYLYFKILYWFYYRQNRSMALRFRPAFERLLRRIATSHEAIKGEECWSLFYELSGDLAKAIVHRRNEIQLIKRFQKLRSGLGDYGPEDLAESLALLAILYKESGQLPEAIGALLEGKRVCAMAKIEFDDSGLLESYRAESSRLLQPRSPRRNSLRRS